MPSTSKVDGLKITPNWPYYFKAPTVNDLKTKRCWICLGEEDAAELAEGEKPRLAQDRWIHACRCSLISHESCLLTWIESNLASSASKAAKCPQCSTRYAIKAKRSRFLSILNRGYFGLNGLYYKVGLGIGFGTTMLVGASYGAFAIRTLIGGDAFRFYFGDTLLEWTLHSFEFAFVPISLLLDTPLVDALFPISIPLTFAAISRLTNRAYHFEFVNPSIRTPTQRVPGAPTNRVRSQ